MRILTTSMAVLAGLGLVAPASAQQVWRNGRWVDSASHGPSASDRHNRWGGAVRGRWYAGYYAPGGWDAYRRPVRGAALPGYWSAPAFRIDDYRDFGLPVPPQGYGWVRYYDDAVLLDAGGRVFDSRSGVAWDADVGAPAGHDYSESHASAGAAYPQPRGSIDYVDPDIAYQPAPLPVRAPGSPVGGDVPPVAFAPPVVQVTPGCAQACPVTYYTGGYGYQGGYAYGGSTTILVQTAPVLTTTVTEEIIEETSYAPARRVVRRRPAVHRARPTPKPRALCCCACR